MKKFIMFFVVIALACVMFSCQKSDEVTPKKQYLDYFKEGVVVKLISSDLKKNTFDFPKCSFAFFVKKDNIYVLADKDLFLPDCDAFNYWKQPGVNPVETYDMGTISFPFWPKCHVRMTAYTHYFVWVGQQQVFFAYAGIHDVDTQSSGGFIVPIRMCQLGEYLAINNHLKNLYPNIKLSVSYNYSNIDLAKTFIESNNTDKTWLKYTYSPELVPVLDKAVEGDGDVVLDNEFSHKIIGEIILKLTLNGNTRVIKTPASEPGDGLIIDVDTDRVGSNSSAPINLTTIPIKIVRRTVKF